MKKRYKHAPQKMMRRSARVFLNALNIGKDQVLTDFLHRCHDAMQYFVDSGAPRRVIPIPSTKVSYSFLADGWQMAKTIRSRTTYESRLLTAPPQERSRNSR